MDKNIEMAVEKLCEDIRLSKDATDNDKRANAILALAFADAFINRENNEEAEEEIDEELSNEDDEPKNIFKSYLECLRTMSRKMVDGITLGSLFDGKGI